MLRVVSWSSLLCGSALALATACGSSPLPANADVASAINGTGPSGAGGSTGCWIPETQIEIYANMNVAPALDPNGQGAARLAALQAAAAAWNAELTAIDSKVRIAILDASTQRPIKTGKSWNAAATGLESRCKESSKEGGQSISDRRFNANGVSAASFLENTNGPGYSTSTAAKSISADALAETSVARGATGYFAEVDVIFHTHDNTCAQLPWHFDGTSPLGATDYDFQSVALHELGHVLGLDHQAPDNANNAMRLGFAPGSRYAIGVNERNALAALYEGCGVAGSGAGGGSGLSSSGAPDTGNYGPIPEIPKPDTSSGNTK